MPGTLWGADVAQLRTLAQQLSKTADLLQQQSTQLSGQINNNNPAWKGADASRFRSDWNGSHRALLQQTVSRLQQESKMLLKNADEQEKASAAPGGLPGLSAGAPLTPFVPLAPSWLSNGNSPFRSGWDAYNGVLGLKTVPLGVRDIGQFASVYGDEVVDAPLKVWNKALWETAQRQDPLRGLFSGTPDLLSAKFGDFAQMTRGLDGAEIGKYTKFGLNSLGHSLGAVGVELDGLDTVNAVRAGETGDALRSGTKAVLGALSFAPPPIGVSCMVISGAWAAVELIPGAKDAIEDTFDGLGNAFEDAGKSVSDGVKDFFGW
ncbi:WXG100 family type VII secretion target [Arthrobacter sp. C152]